VIAVGDEEVLQDHACIIDHGRPDIGELEIVLAIAQVGQEGIQFAVAVSLRPVGEARLRRDEHDSGLRQVGSDSRDQFLRLLENNAGLFASSDVIVPLIDEERIRSLVFDEFIVEVNQVTELRPPESEILHIMMRKLRLQILPPNDAGATRKNDAR
tara:strand:+ start:77 stop:544 length:468 start_codon:yes stop_codon:yes gene_type:complete